MLDGCAVLILEAYKKFLKTSSDISKEFQMPFCQDSSDTIRILVINH